MVVTFDTSHSRERALALLLPPAAGATSHPPAVAASAGTTTQQLQLLRRVADSSSVAPSPSVQLQHQLHFSGCAAGNKRPRWYVQGAGRAAGRHRGARDDAAQPPASAFASITFAQPPAVIGAGGGAALSNSRSSSGGSGRNGGVDLGASPSLDRQHHDAATLVALPLVTHKGKQTFRYVWDGRRIVAVSEDSLLRGSQATHSGRLHGWLSELGMRLRDAFLPDPRDVTPDYWQWLRWRLSQRFFSSTLQNFSTQALLMALGLGAKKSFASSAAINWLLKEGVGRVARMTVATNFGQTFDADLKRMRMVTSLIFTACLSGEFLTPIFPDHFVALASIANVGRAIGLTAFVATTPAFQQALATGGNLADLTSKNQAQHMLCDMAALGVSAALTYALRHSDRARVLLPLIAFPICATGDLFSIYKELKSVELKSLNRERTEMLAESWVASGGGSSSSSSSSSVSSPRGATSHGSSNSSAAARANSHAASSSRGGSSRDSSSATPGASTSSGYVPPPAEVARNEPVLFPSDVSNGLLPLKIVPVCELVSCPAQLTRLMARYRRDRYMLRLAQAGDEASSSHGSGGTCGACGYDAGAANGGGGWRAKLREQPPRLLVSLTEDAQPTDIMAAILEAAYVRQAVVQHVASQHSAAAHCPPEAAATAAAAAAGKPADGAPHGTNVRRQQHAGHEHHAHATRPSLASDQDPHCLTSGGRCCGLASDGTSCSDAASSSGTQQRHHRAHSGATAAASDGAGAATSVAAVAAPATGMERWCYGHSRMALAKRLLPPCLWGGTMPLPLSDEQLDAIVAAAHTKAWHTRERFISDVVETGWKPRPFMLSTSEKIPYVQFDVPPSLQ